MPVAETLYYVQGDIGMDAAPNAPSGFAIQGRIGGFQIPLNSFRDLLIIDQC